MRTNYKSIPQDCMKQQEYIYLMRQKWEEMHFSLYTIRTEPIHVLFFVVVFLIVNVIIT